jgi:TonB family protein
LLTNLGFTFLAFFLLITSYGITPPEMTLPYTVSAGSFNQSSVSIRVSDNGDIFFNGQKIDWASLNSRYRSQRDQLEAMKIGADLFRPILTETPEYLPQSDKKSALNNKSKPDIHPDKLPEMTQIAKMETPMDYIAGLNPENVNQSFNPETAQNISQETSNDTHAVNLPVVQTANIPSPKVDTSMILDEYSAGIKSRILQHKTYPKICQRKKETGSVKVEFTVDQSGGISHAQIIGSSPFDRLNQSALDSVYKASPFSPIPRTLPNQSLTMSVDIVFEILD